ncbi:MAG TPA: SMR family transporter [Duganella sp.]|nr:SMR family transporter [Duganella sp.]
MAQSKARFGGFFLCLQRTHAGQQFFVKEIGQRLDARRCSWRSPSARWHSNGANGAIALLTIALKQLPVGTAFAIFTGLGAAGVAVIGIAPFGESASPLRLVLIAAVIACIAGLKWTAGVR